MWFFLRGRHLVLRFRLPLENVLSGSYYLGYGFNIIWILFVFCHKSNEFWAKLQIISFFFAQKKDSVTLQYGQNLQKFYK